MFALHETTRKRTCRTAFFALCLAPTFATAAWIGSQHAPGRKGRLARELGETLDGHVKLADWRQPRPRVVRCSHMTLSDASSGRSLAELASLELRGGGGKRFLEVEKLTIDGAQRARLGEKLHGWLTKLPPEAHEVHCGMVTINPQSIEGGEQSDYVGFVLHDVRGRVERDAAGRVRAQIAARISTSAEQTAAEIRLTLTPSKDDSSAAPSVTLDTQSASIPAWVLAGFVPGFGNLGADARFTGVVRWTLGRPQSLGSAQGRVDAVDLARILPPGSPHRLHGPAEIELLELRWHGGRMERFVGEIRATDVRVSRSLVDAMATNFQCVRSGEGVPVAEDGSLVAVDVLAVPFELDGKGLTFWGACPPELNLEAGCMAVSGLRPLLFGPRYRDWPLGVLVQTLAAPSSASLPATREAVDLAERLPLPRR